MADKEVIVPLLGHEHKMKLVDLGSDVHALATAGSGSGGTQPVTIPVVATSLANGVQVATAGAAAVQLIAANANRRKLIIQYVVGTVPARIGAAGVTATTGMYLNGVGSSIILEGEDCPKNAIHFIRDGGSDVTLFVAEVA